jgi:hypothetical protein
MAGIVFSSICDETERYCGIIVCTFDPDLTRQ